MWVNYVQERSLGSYVLHILRIVLRVPKLGGDKDIIAPDAAGKGRPKTLPHLLLVSVASRTVNMPVPDLQGSLLSKQDAVQPVSEGN